MKYKRVRFPSAAGEDEPLVAEPAAEVPSTTGAPAKPKPAAKKKAKAAAPAPTTTRPRAESTQARPPAGEPVPLVSPPDEPGLRDVAERLERHGATPAFLERILTQVAASGARGAYAIDVAARAIGEAFPVHKSPRLNREAGAGNGPHVLTFVGPTGAGKSATVAKLGRRLVQAGRRVAFASLDAVGTSALETVGGVTADLDRGEIPLVAVQNATQLRRFLRRARQADVCLIDTPGLSPRETDRLNTLAAELSGVGSNTPMDVYLTLPAPSSRGALDLVVRSFRRLGVSAAVITKLDETDEPGGALELCLDRHLPLALFGDGQDVRRHLMRARREWIADLFLTGRLR